MNAMNARNRSLGYLGGHPETKQGKRLYPDNCNRQHKSFRKPRHTNLSQGFEQPKTTISDCHGLQEHS